MIVEAKNKGVIVIEKNKKKELVEQKAKQHAEVLKTRYGIGKERKHYGR